MCVMRVVAENYQLQNRCIKYGCSQVHANFLSKHMCKTQTNNAYRSKMNHFFPLSSEGTAPCERLQGSTGLGIPCHGLGIPCHALGICAVPAQYQSGQSPPVIHQWPQYHECVPWDCLLGEVVTSQTVQSMGLLVVLYV